MVADHCIGFEASVVILHVYTQYIATYTLVFFTYNLHCPFLETAGNLLTVLSFYNQSN